LKPGNKVCRTYAEALFGSLFLRERVRVRGMKNKDIFLFDPLIPTFSRRAKGRNA
jgi:hypothetical protein